MVNIHLIVQRLRYVNDIIDVDQYSCPMKLGYYQDCMHVYIHKQENDVPTKLSCYNVNDERSQFRST